LIEILVATAVLAILLSLILTILNSVSTTVRHTSAKVDAFASARAAFTLLSQRLAQATLNTYWAYDQPPPQTPTAYLRQSDLQFTVVQNTRMAGYGQEAYFHTPQSYSDNNNLRTTEGLLNATSFFVQFGSNDSFRPNNLTEKKYRYRLMQGLQPTERLSTFKDPATTTGVPNWAGEIGNSASPSSYVSPLSDNVIAVIAWPRLSPHDDPTGAELTGDYTYDSKKDATRVPQPPTANQLPPMVQLTMVVISEASAVRLDKQSSTPPPEIEGALQGKFANVNRYKTDLDDLQRELTAKNIEFEVFTTTVPLSGSKWSDDQ
jgi:uncharacterized protein (TIGR02599 family)